MRIRIQSSQSFCSQKTAKKNQALFTFKNNKKQYPEYAITFISQTRVSRSWSNQNISQTYQNVEGCKQHEAHSLFLLQLLQKRDCSLKHEELSLQTETDESVASENPPFLQRPCGVFLLLERPSSLLYNTLYKHNILVLLNVYWT